MNFHFSKQLSYENAHDCCPTSKPSVSAVLFGFHGINLFKNLVSRELLQILENFHFSISILKHFDFTFHFSKKSESIFFTLHFLKKSENIFISLCTSRKRVKAFIFHFSLSELPKPILAVPANKPLFSNCQALCCHQQHQNQQYVMHTEMKKNDRVSQSPCIQLQHADTSQLIINN